MNLKEIAVLCRSTAQNDYQIDGHYLPVGMQLNAAADDLLSVATMPVAVREALIRYRDDRIETGGFLRAVLEGNLFDAIARADSTNRLALAVIVEYVVAFLPSRSYGSQKNVRNWLGGKKHVTA